MNLLQQSSGRVSNNNSSPIQDTSSATTTQQLFIAENEVLVGLDPTNPYEMPNPIWFNTLCLLGFLVFFRVLGYIVLRIYHKPA